MSVKSIRPQRSLADIRTMAGKSTDASRQGYAAYFEMGALELERMRRSQEREAAQRRIDEIDRRIAEIDAQMDLLARGVAEESARRSEVEPGRRGAAPPARSRRGRAGSAGGTEAAGVLRAGGSAAEQTAPGERRGLRIRY